MSSEREEERLVESVKKIQLGKLRANSHKVHWADGLSTLEDRERRALALLALLEGEIEELKEQLVGSSKKTHPNVLNDNRSLANAGKIRAEVADISNIAAMIADVSGTDSDDPAPF